MAERTSYMGTKTQLSRMLSLEAITGPDAEIATVHEINRQSAVKEILVHVFFMSKFDIIAPPLTLSAAKSQYFRATGEHEAAHNAPCQILNNGEKIQACFTNADELQVTVDNLFGRTDGIHGKFNNADSRAEENGLCEAFLDACNYIANVAKTARFGRAHHAYPRFASAFDVYASAGLQAFQNAVIRQRALMKPNDPVDVATREETISILDIYRRTLDSSESTHETVQGLFPENIWRQYAAI